MSNDLVSLDDIIKKSKPGSIMRSRGGPRQNVVKGKPRINGAAPNKPGPRSSVEDARFKIIQKKRKHIADARDKLAQIAKQSDARLKLEKLRATTSKKDLAGISRKTGRNGRLTLTTNKPPPQQMTHSMPPAFIPPTTRAMTYRPPPIPQPHYMNEMIRTYAEEFPKKRDFEYFPYESKEYLMDQQPTMRRTVNNDYTPTLPPPPPMFAIKPTPYRDWDKPPSHSSNSISRSQPMRSSDHSRPRDYKVIPRTDMTKITSAPSYKNDWSFSSKTRTIIPDANSKYYTVKNHRDMGVRSRLQASPPPMAPPKSNRSTLNSARPKTGSQTAGYRIVVSNLQSNVTQEDIKELFEDVGELLVSRLVRPGIAEVIYKTLKDATKAVETYHNRQLDGHPMKCLLVNPRPKGSTSSSSSSSRSLSHSRSSNSYGQSSLGAVHRALFDR